MPKEAATRPRLWILDSDLRSYRELVDALKGAGVRVGFAPSVEALLQEARERGFDALIVESRWLRVGWCSLIDLLRDAPLAGHAEILVCSPSEEPSEEDLPSRWDAPEFGGSEFALVQKPFRVPEMSSRLLQGFRKKERALPQMLHAPSALYLRELLEVFVSHRRSGVLSLAHQGREGRVVLERGELLDARLGKALVGPKALIRLMGLPASCARFWPEAPRSPRTLFGAARALFQLADREQREIEHWKAKLPLCERPLRAERGLLAGSRLNRVQHAIWSLLASKARELQELLDELPDFDSLLMENLAELLEAGLVRPLDDARAGLRFCSDEELPRWQRTLRQLSGWESGRSPRIALTSQRPERIECFLRALRPVREFRMAATALPSLSSTGFGSLGELRLGASAVELVALPLNPSWMPLWESLTRPERRALLLDSERDAWMQRLEQTLGMKLVIEPAAWQSTQQALDALRRTLNVPRADRL